MAGIMMFLLFACVLNAWSSIGTDENAYQQFIGCAFNSTGQVGHFWRYGYNSKDIMHIDLVKETMVSTSNAGHFLAEERKSVEYIHSKQERLRKVCSAVQTVFLLSNSSLSRAAKPTVHVRVQGEQGKGFLMCQVHGFYPNVIRVQWTRQGKSVYYGVSTAGILPHKDGTFQMTSYLSLGNSSAHGVTCNVEHISFGGKMRATLEERTERTILLLSTAVTVGAFLAGLVLPVGTVVVVIRFTRKRAPIQNEDASNEHSEDSGTPPSMSLLL